jgi:hypothetical protein
MMKNKKLKLSNTTISRILGITSLVLAIIATVYMSFWGGTRVSESIIGNGMTITERVGAFSPYLIIFTLFPIIGVAAIYMQNKKVLWATVVSMFLLSVLLIFSYGSTFSPSLIFLVAAAIALNNLVFKTRMTNKKLFLVGIASVFLSHLINSIAGWWLYEPVLFPVAFIIAAMYGWWSRNYLYSFLVGFFSIPFMISRFPPYVVPFIFNLDLVDTLFFSALGIISGLIGMGFVKLQRRVFNSLRTNGG